MILGFTGTQRGMSDRQKLTVGRLFAENLTELHHGWCIGSDADAHFLAKEVHANIVGHPPRDPTRMANLPVCDFSRIYPSYRYLTRNRHIVRDGVDGLIATPKNFIKPASLIGEGTWMHSRRSAIFGLCIRMERYRWRRGRGRTSCEINRGDRCFVAGVQLRPPSARAQHESQMLCKGPEVFIMWTHTSL